MENLDVLSARDAEATSAAEVIEAANDGRVRRSGLDRRQFTWRTVAYSFVRPRRKRVNRADDRGNHHVDFHPKGTPWLCAGIVMLAAIDAYLTLTFFDAGVRQLNPLVVMLIEAGRGVYVSAKLLGTSVFVLMLAAVSSVRVYGLMPARHFLYVVFIVYALIVLNMMRYVS